MNTITKPKLPILAPKNLVPKVVPKVLSISAIPERSSEDNKLYILMSFDDNGPNDVDDLFYATSELQVVATMIKDIEEYLITNDKKSDGAKYVNIFSSMGGEFDGERGHPIHLMVDHHDNDMEFARKLVELSPETLLKAINESYMDGDSSLSVVIAHHYLDKIKTCLPI